MKRLFATCLLWFAFPAAASEDRTQIVLHLLDYVAVDYGAAVAEGQVTNDLEFQEMREFTARAIEHVEALAATPSREQLVEQAVSLAAEVESKADPDAVAAAARRLSAAIIRAYDVRTHPQQPPDLVLGQRIYTENCASCHGAHGRGDGPAAPGQDPAPSDFHDATRMAERSLYGLYSTVTLGVDGTAMPSFDLLDEHERWSVAAAVARLDTGELPSGLDRTGRLLADAVLAFREGRHDEAQDLAIQAYLDGFEPVEGSLSNLDAVFVRELERNLMGLRGVLRPGGSIEDVEQRALAIEEQLARARTLLGAQGLSQAATFASSFLILLREGLEAILVLAAVIAFVKKGGRRDALPYVHAGWIAAVVSGLLTWVMAVQVVELSGADREVTEGVTALIAAAMLLYVGYWLHNKAYAQAWTRFIREQVGTALAKRAWWAMAAAAFLAVYREMFETVLFYQALWVQAAPRGSQAFFGGLLAAAAALVAVGWLVFRCSVRLPIGPFFAVTSVLLASLAVVFAGQGVAALQEAGVVSITPVASFAAPVLGVFPTAQTLAAQAAMALAVATSFYLAARNGRAAV